MLNAIADGAITHSVWNSSTLSWDYYRGPLGAHLKDGIFAPPTTVCARELGVSLDTAVRTLPLGAELVGHGDYARGLVASRKGVLDRVTGNLGRTAVYALAVLGAFSLVRRA